MPSGQSVCVCVCLCLNVRVLECVYLCACQHVCRCDYWRVNINISMSMLVCMCASFFLENISIYVHIPLYIKVYAYMLDVFRLRRSTPCLCSSCSWRSWRSPAVCPWRCRWAVWLSCWCSCGFRPRGRSPRRGYGTCTWRRGGWVCRGPRLPRCPPPSLWCCCSPGPPQTDPGIPSHPAEGGGLWRGEGRHAMLHYILWHTLLICTTCRGDKWRAAARRYNASSWWIIWRTLCIILHAGKGRLQLRAKAVCILSHNV